MLYYHVAPLQGQVFPRMRNFTATHRMTGVGNALKRHYQALLLDYEQARRWVVGRGVGVVGRGKEAPCLLSHQTDIQLGAHPSDH